MKSQVRYEKTKPIGDKKANLESYSEAVQAVLQNRGIFTEAEAKKILEEDYEKGIHDPFLMLGMKEAVTRIISALEKEEKVVIFSDYDADGVPGAVILQSFFEDIGFKDVVSYIPHRGIEGFGLNEEAIKELAETGANLLITVDCGISDIEEVRLANELGMDVIITDHHLPDKKLPPALAILNPKQDKCKYPFKELCGAGVAYKLVQALMTEEGVNFSLGQEKWLLDLVGLATIADMVPLIDENRIFARYGLLVLRKGRRLGLRELLSQARADHRYLNEEDISFTIAPRINAASRMSHPDIAFNLLNAKNRKDAIEHALQLEKINKERKTLVARIVKEAKKNLSTKHDLPVLVTGNPNWKPGILGLIAGSLADSFNRPTFVWGRGEEGGDLKGSARSEGRTNIVELMRALPEGFFINSGGHEMSGGFSVSLENISSLESSLNEVYENLFSDETEEEALIKSFDFTLRPEDINRDLFEEVLSLGPFGVGFERPVFKIEGAQIVSVREFGKEKNHLEVCINSRGNLTCNAIGFFMTRKNFDHDLEIGDRVTLYGSLEKSYFLGRMEYRIRIEHLE